MYAPEVTVTSVKDVVRTVGCSRIISELLDEFGYPDLDAPYEYRKGRCYSLALRYFAQRYRDGLVLVHGFPRLGGRGRLYGHGWVEVDGVTVWEPIHSVNVPVPLFYQAGAIDPEVAARWATPDAALATMLEHGTIGCWAPEDGL